MTRHFCWLMMLILFTSGCVSARQRHALPYDLLDKAQISNIQDIRAFDGKPSSYLMADFMKLFDQEEKEEKETSIWEANSSHTYSVLAISGGAANGAYGVGLLNGWTREGSRPVFKIVTGVSTGAIIAPFAFIGSKYDEKLKEFYTKYSTKEIMQRKDCYRSFLVILI